jgi:hypothetical protein
MMIFKEMRKWENLIWYLDADSGRMRGIAIESCDNPGWWVKIDLHGTKYLNCPFEPIQVNVGESGHPESRFDWLACYLKDGIFNGAGDPGKLKTVLNIFFEWIKRNGFDHDYDHDKIASLLEKRVLGFPVASAQKPAQKVVVAVSSNEETRDLNNYFDNYRLVWLCWRTAVTGNSIELTLLLRSKQGEHFELEFYDCENMSLELCRDAILNKNIYVTENMEIDGKIKINLSFGKDAKAEKKEKISIQCRKWKLQRHQNDDEIMKASGLSGDVKT